MAFTKTNDEILIAIRVATSVDGIDAAMRTAASVHIDAAKELILNYAPDAPDAVHDGALARMVAWLWFVTPNVFVDQSPLTQSGAAALLSRWVARRAVPVGTDGPDAGGGGDAPDGPAGPGGGNGGGSTPSQPLGPEETLYHVGYIAHNAADTTVAAIAARIVDFSGDYSTGGTSPTLPDRIPIQVPASGDFVLYLLARTGHPQPVGFTSSGIATKAFSDGIDRSIGGHSFKAYVLRPVFLVTSDDNGDFFGVTPPE